MTNWTIIKQRKVQPKSGGEETEDRDFIDDKSGKGSYERICSGESN